MKTLSENLIEIAYKYLKLLIYNVIGLVIFSCGWVSISFSQAISETMGIRINYHNNKDKLLKGALYTITAIFLIITILTYVQLLISNNNVSLILSLLPLFVLSYLTTSFIIFYIPVSVAYDLSFLDKIKIILILPLSMPLMFVMLLLFNLSIYFAIYTFPYLLIFGVYMINVFINTIIFNVYFLKKLNQNRKEISANEI